jgi:hypothetical protein
MAFFDWCNEPVNIQLKILKAEIVPVHQLNSNFAGLEFKRNPAETQSNLTQDNKKNTHTHKHRTKKQTAFTSV